MANLMQNSVLSLNYKKNLPKSAKTNTTKAGNKKPMTLKQAQQLYNKPLNFLSFRRIARNYYKTASCENSQQIILTNTITGNSIFLNLKSENNTIKAHKYIRTPKGSTVYVSVTLRNIESNRDLFIKLISKKYV